MNLKRSEPLMINTPGFSLMTPFTHSQANDSPQPHEDAAFGLFILKPPPINRST